MKLSDELEDILENLPSQTEPTTMTTTVFSSDLDSMGHSTAVAIIIQGPGAEAIASKFLYPSPDISLA